MTMNMISNCEESNRNAGISKGSSSSSSSGEEGEEKVEKKEKDISITNETNTTRTATNLSSSSKSMGSSKSNKRLRRNLGEKIGFLTPTNGSVSMKLQLDFHFAGDFSSDCKNLYAKYKLFVREEDEEEEEEEQEEEEDEEEDEDDKYDEDHEIYISTSQKQTQSMIQLKCLVEGTTVTSKPNASGQFNFACSISLDFNYDYINHRLRRLQRDRRSNCMATSLSQSSQSSSSLTHRTSDHCRRRRRLNLNDLKELGDDEDNETSAAQVTEKEPEENNDEIENEEENVGEEGVNHNENDNLRRRRFNHKSNLLSSNLISSSCKTNPTHDTSHLVSSSTRRSRHSCRRRRLERQRQQQGRLDSITTNSPQRPSSSSPSHRRRRRQDGLGEIANLILVVELYSSNFYHDKLQGWSNLIIPVCEPNCTNCGTFSSISGKKEIFYPFSQSRHSYLPSESTLSTSSSSSSLLPLQQPQVFQKPIATTTSGHVVIDENDEIIAPSPTRTMMKTMMLIDDNTRNSLRVERLLCATNLIAYDLVDDDHLRLLSCEDEDKIITIDGQSSNVLSQSDLTNNTTDQTNTFCRCNQTDKTRKRNKIALPVIRPYLTALIDKLRYYLIGQLPRNAPIIGEFVNSTQRYLTQTEQSGTLVLSYDLVCQYSDPNFDAALENLLELTKTNPKMSGLLSSSSRAHKILKSGWILGDSKHVDDDDDDDDANTYAFDESERENGIENKNRDYCDESVDDDEVDLNVDKVVEAYRKAKERINRLHSVPKVVAGNIP